MTAGMLEAVVAALGLCLGLVGLVRSYSSGDNKGGARSVSPANIRRGAIAGACGLAVYLVTGWPAAAILAAGASLGVPALLGVSANTVAADRVEAIAAWAEMLRDTLSAAAGLTQAIIATARIAPAPIAPEVKRLVAALEARVQPAVALGSFADDVADPACDLVVAALVLAMTRRAGKLTELLDELATAARRQVAMRLRVEAARASSRSAVRIVTVFSLGFAGALALLAHSYLAPYGSLAGQIALLVVGALYATGLGLMVWMVRVRPAPRLITRREP